MRVYSRWGSLVYETKNIPLNEDKYGWDGYFNGKELPPDVFTYYMEIEFIDGEIVPYKGDITIIK
jgi:gliding motility-associated-like protein